MPQVKTVIIVFTLALIVLHEPTAAAFTSASADSIGIETKDGKTFILHKVAPGETLYSLSRRYNASVSGILKSNPGADSGIRIEQILRIPYEKKTELAKGATRHEVRPGETMFSISRKYNVRLSDIKKWNNLESTALNIGQKLVIYPGADDTNKNTAPAVPVAKATGEGDIVHTVSSSQTLYSISRKYNVSMTDIKKWNNLKDASLSIGQKLIIKSAEQPVAIGKKPKKVDKKEVVEAADKNSGSQTGNSDYKEYETSMEEIKRVNKSKPQSRKTSNRGFNKVVELGFAEVIETENKSKKWLALHRTAPIGTILRIKNEMNNLWVFVRVIGVLPDTSVNDKVLVKISKTAYDKLGAINERFPVEISYVP